MKKEWISPTIVKHSYDDIYILGGPSAGVENIAEYKASL